MSWRIAFVVCGLATIALQVASQDEESWNDIGVSLDSGGQFTERYGHESDESLALAKLLSALKQEPMRETSELDERDSGMQFWDQLLDRSDEPAFRESVELDSPSNLASRYDPREEDVGTLLDDTRLSTDPSLYVEQNDGNIAQVMNEEYTEQVDASTGDSASDESMVAQNGESVLPEADDSMYPPLGSGALNFGDVALSTPSETPLLYVNPSAFSRENSESVITDSPRSRSRSPTKPHKLDLHSHAKFHDIHTHSNHSSSLAETTASSSQKQDKKEDPGSSAAKENAPSGPFGWLLKAIYYDGVLAMSAPWRPIAMILLATIVAFPCFLLGYWMKPVNKDRNRFTHHGRVVYEWKDSSETIVLYTKLPKGLTAKGLDIKMWPHHLKMGRVGKQPFIREELFGAIVVDKSFWDVSNDELVVTLFKDSDATWPCVFRAHHPGRSAHANTLL